MARPRKTCSALQGNLTKEQIKDRMEKEQAVTGDSDNIPVPVFILGDPIAEDEYNRVVEELLKVNIVTNVDSTLLGIYADSYSKYVQATRAMEDEPMVMEYTNKAGATNQVISPYIKIQQQYAQQIMKISTLYGFDPSSRSKIAHLQPSDKNEKTDPLADLLSGLRGK